MSDDASLMTQKEMMRQIYSLQKESSENDARLGAQIENVVRRLDKQDRLLEKMNEAFLNQTNILHSLDVVDKKMTQLSEAYNERVKEGILINKSLESLKEKTDKLLYWKEGFEKRVNDLEVRGAKTVFTVVKKIGGIVLTMIVTAVTAYLIGKFKG
ncbi:MAG: hypothetical protein ACTTKC_10345 [Treponema sp.]|uniref:hypothetical protein n=1 Tax=Treponema sp. TaxID=166 RepID=UPI003FA24440